MHLIQLISPGGWSIKFQVGAIYAPSPPKTGQICDIPAIPPIVERLCRD